MHLIITRSFPPELGGMQCLMWGLTRELSKNFMIKVLPILLRIIKLLMSNHRFQLKELVDLNYLESTEKLI